MHSKNWRSGMAGMSFRSLTLAAASAVVLAACAANSGVVAMGPDTFFVSRQAATGFTGAGTLKADAIAEAGRFCTQRGQTAEVVSAKESHPPYVLTNFPRAELEFKCVKQ